MTRALVSGLALAVGVGGCAEQELARAPSGRDEAVLLANRDPGPDCRRVQCLAVRSGDGDPSAPDLVSADARERGANYVVVDGFAVVEEVDGAATVLQARLFRCPPLARAAPIP